MKSILKKISILFLVAVLVNLYGCKSSKKPNTDTSAATAEQAKVIPGPTEGNPNEQVPQDALAQLNDQDIPIQEPKTVQDSIQLMNSSVAPIGTTKDIVEGNVPPTDKKITMYYYVHSGDNLTKIAKKIYGNNSSWKKLAEFNNLKNPNQIYAGDFIRYELDKSTKNFADAYENVGKTKIIVRKGDSLSRVARTVFGKNADWRVLWKENPRIKNPDKIIIGEALFFKPKNIQLTKLEEKKTPQIVDPFALPDNSLFMEAKPNLQIPGIEQGDSTSFSMEETNILNFDSPLTQ